MHLDIHKAKLILNVKRGKDEGEKKKKKQENILKSRDFCNFKKKKCSNRTLLVDIYGVYVGFHSRFCS